MLKVTQYDTIRHLKKKSDLNFIMQLNWTQMVLNCLIHLNSPLRIFFWLCCTFYLFVAVVIFCLFFFLFLLFFSLFVFYLMSSVQWWPVFMKIVRHCERPKKRRSPILQPFEPSRSNECKEQVDILSNGVCCYFQQKNTDYD